MSDIAITVQKVRSVEAHPYSERLEIILVLGTQCVVGKGDHHVGDRVIYFPPDMLIPEHVADLLKVKKYLKHAMWKGKKKQSRIAACRIRGVPSYGFVAPCVPQLAVGFDATTQWEGEKYEPPALTNTHTLAEGNLHKYTDIQHYWSYPDVFEPDDNVVVTEKIHGTNSRVGLLFEDDEWVFAAGSHNVRCMQDDVVTRYWKPLSNHGVLSLLIDLCGECSDAVVYGEIYGSNVQDMDYGVEGDEGYQVFDIKVDGVFLNWIDVHTFCLKHGVSTVPVLFFGPWSSISGFLDEYASSKTLVGEPKRKFKGREGIVIKSAMERQTCKIMGDDRAILKYVSADYLDRRGAQDNG